MTTPAALRTFEMAHYLDSEAAIAEYLSQVLADGDAVELAQALGDIARARGMSRLARETGLSRESLYKGLSGQRTPSAETLLKVVRALGYQLSIAPAGQAATTAPGC